MLARRAPDPRLHRIAAHRKPGDEIDQGCAFGVRPGKLGEKFPEMVALSDAR